MKQTVRCATCGGIYYETTDAYDPDKSLTGNMLRLCKPYSTYQWPVYDGALAYEGTQWHQMYCCQCGGWIATNGKLKFVDEPVKSEWVCSECGKVCKSKAGLAAHIRISHNG